MQINPTSTNNPGNATNRDSIRLARESDSRFPAHKLGPVSQEQEQLSLQQERLSIDEVEIFRAIERANTSLECVYTQFEFSIHEKTREIMVKVIDRDSGEVIREIPPEQILDLVAKMWELAGIIVDERV